jgi:acetylornithine/N-succinyldiaminopimelate aminotransferase
MLPHDRDRKFIVPTYERSPFIPVRGEGSYLYDASGARFLDLAAGLGVNALGYAHPRIISAIEQQLRRFTHVSNTYVQETQLQLAEMLLDESQHFSSLFYCNSGAEATESAIKLVRKWGSSRAKHTLIGFTKGFHGRTTGALALMSTEKYREGYGPFIDACQHVPYNDPQALRDAVNEDTCAVFLEYIQGEGGVIPASEEFISELYALRERFNFLIVADEIQTGIGRTGEMFAFNWYSGTPDIVCVAKAIGSGLPLGALLMNDELKSVYGLGRHGTTFGGNPVACAAGIEVLRAIKEQDLLAHVKNLEALFMRRLLDAKAKYPDLILDVRGRGLMIGVELSAPFSGLRDMFLEHGVIVNVTQGNIIRILAPLILSADEAEIALKAFDDIFASLSSL